MENLNIKPAEPKKIKLDFNLCENVYVLQPQN